METNKETERELSLYELLKTFNGVNTADVNDFEQADDVFFDLYASGFLVLGANEIIEVMTELAQANAVDSFKENEVLKYCTTLTFPFFLYVG